MVKLCRYLEVSKSGYYSWENRKISPRKQQNLILLYAIKEIHQQSRDTYGSPRIYKELNAKGYLCGIRLVERLMKVGKIYSKISKKFKHSTTNSNHSYEVSPNILNQKFQVEEPGEVWVSDITYIKVNKEWMYLTVILDLFNREVIGWDFSSNLESSSLIKAFNKSYMRYKPKRGCVFHSDRGVQYASKEFRNLLKEKGMQQSMSRSGNCYDNACAESFFKTLKVENIYHQDYKSEIEAKRDLFEYIEIFYNQNRIHSYLGYASPKEFRKLYCKRDT